MSEVVKGWAEFDKTVATAEAIGFFRGEALCIIRRMGRETSWDMKRIGKEMILTYRGTKCSMCGLILSSKKCLMKIGRDSTTRGINE